MSAVMAGREEDGVASWTRWGDRGPLWCTTTSAVARKQALGPRPARRDELCRREEGAASIDSRGICGLATRGRGHTRGDRHCAVIPRPAGAARRGEGSSGPTEGQPYGVEAHHQMRAHRVRCPSQPWAAQAGDGVRREDELVGSGRDHHAVLLLSVGGFDAPRHVSPIIGVRSPSAGCPGQRWTRSPQKVIRQPARPICPQRCLSCSCS